MTSEEMLDKLEDLLVRMIRDMLNEARKPHAQEITYDEARNMLGNIGTRITFGKDIFDATFEKKGKPNGQES